MANEYEHFLLRSDEAAEASKRLSEAACAAGIALADFASAAFNYFTIYFGCLSHYDGEKGPILDYLFDENVARVYLSDKEWHIYKHCKKSRIRKKWANEAVRRQKRSERRT